MTETKEFCEHCGKPVVHQTTNVLCIEWIHADGFYNCDGYRGHATTYAEPKKETSEIPYGCECELCEESR